MSPRPAPSRSDETAEKFLNAAASLIDAALAESGTHVPPRLRALRFPAALEWMRTEDVLRTVMEQDEAASRKAFRNRWAVKDDFVTDAIIHALLYRDLGGGAAPLTHSLLEAGLPEEGTLTERLGALADMLEDELAQHPRTWLLAHIAPLFGRHPDVAEPVIRATRADQDVWVEFYRSIIQRSGVTLRPGWTPERMQLGLQCALDGVMLRRRIDPERFHDSRWSSAHQFADLALAFLCGIIDLDASDQSTADWLEGRMSALLQSASGEAGDAWAEADSSGPEKTPGL